MKTLTLVAALLVSASSYAAKFSFTHFGNEGGRQSFYACSFVEDQTIAHLETLGATNIDVSCSGGIGYGWGAQPVSIRASYDVPEVTGVEVSTVEIKGHTWNPACGINVRILKEALKTFKNITVVKKDDACAFASSNYSYKLKIAR